MVRTFGKYLLDEEIARGGMSRVFSARLRGLGGFEKKLVVKQVLPELASDPRFVSMFVDEAKTLVQMSHPHIAPVYELGVVDGVYFLAMEYVEGSTLSGILKDGPLAPGLVAHVGAEICDALHYAHTKFDIVHRDVTPRNVIVDAQGHSRLLDFGIAAAAGEGTEIFGTPGYLSPEQLAGEMVGPASDVFSLGAVLFEMLTGRRAFPGRTVDETRAALERRPMFDDDGVPPELAKIVRRALAPREERYVTARELGRALRGWLASAFPEGVAAELGARASDARDEERRVAEELDHMPTDTAGEVRTLATSRVLDAILDGDAAEESAGTVPIEGRKSIPTPPTVVEVVRREPQQEPHEEPKSFAAQPTSALPTWLALGSAIAVVGALIYIGATQEGPRPPRDVRRTDVAPRQQPIDQPAPPEVIDVRDDAPVDVEPQPPPQVRVEPPPPVQPAAITVNASPWADVILDGRAVGRTPQRRISVRPGHHTIRLRCSPLGREVEHAFDARSDQTLTIVADLNSDPPTVRMR